MHEKIARLLPQHAVNLNFNEPDVYSYVHRSTRAPPGIAHLLVQRAKISKPSMYLREGEQYGQRL